MSLISLLLMSCTSEKAWYHNSGSVWHTGYSVKYRADKDMGDSIVAVMRDVELALSPFEPQSEVSRLNRGEISRVSPGVAVVFHESQRVNVLSAGAFDPTVAPLVNLWGFGYKKDRSYTDSTRVAPPVDSIREALLKVGISDCRVDDSGMITKKHPLTEFDFSAITKGYGVDRVGEMLRRNGITDFMVEIGGEVLTSGDNPDGRPWVIGVAVPSSQTSDVASRRTMRRVNVSGRAMATSGNYINYIDLIDGSRVAHTISPVSGRPVITTTLSVTVMAPSCMTADALATACMAMPLDEAMSMINGLEGVGAMFIIAGPDGEFEVKTVGKWS